MSVTKGASIVGNAEKSVRLKDGAESSRDKVSWFVAQLQSITEKLADVEAQLATIFREVPNAVMSDADYAALEKVVKDAEQNGGLDSFIGKTLNENPNPPAMLGRIE